MLYCATIAHSAASSSACSSTVWVASGAFIGGVVTPILAADRRLSDWTAMGLGLLVGGIGNVVLLIPMAVAVADRPRRNAPPGVAA